MTERASLVDFWRDCQGVGELRLLIDHPAQGSRDVAAPTPFAVLGRDQRCDVALRAERISRRHVYLQVIAGQLWSFDLASRTGMYRGDRRIAAGLITSSDSIRIGSCHVRPQSDADFAGSWDADPRADPLAAQPADADPWPSVTLEFVNAAKRGGGAAPVWQLDRTVTFVGQGPQCKVRFTCTTVSRVHCGLLRTPGGVWLIDLLGRGGVDVNGVRVRWARLRDGDHVRVGRFTMVAHEVAQRGAGPRGAGTKNALALPRTAAAELASLPLSALPLPGTPFAGMPSPGVPFPGMPSGVPAGLDSTQAMLLAMMNQFSTMQQQMFDQFQHTTLMMMQMFGSLQKEQFDLVRQELEGLRELNREMNTLQEELARHKAAGETAPVRRRGKARASQAKPTVVDIPTSEVEPGAVEPAAPPSSPHPSLAEPALLTQPEAAMADSPRADAPPADPSPTRPEPDLSDAPAPVGAAPPGEDVHQWLCQRFAVLQQERQTRWQRLMGVLTGK